MSYRLVGLAGLMPALVLLAGCDSGSPAVDNIDVAAMEAARDSLIDADLAFSALAQEQGLPAAYLQYLAEDAVQLPDGDLPIAGKDAIYANIIAVVESGQFELSWEPFAAEVSAAGDLGYTWGAYYFAALDDDGQRVSYEGKYANVWQRLADGNWQILLDISNQNRADYVDDTAVDDTAVDDTAADDQDSESGAVGESTEPL
jgi:ketosteroid isomerase-like protein